MKVEKTPARLTKKRLFKDIEVVNTDPPSNVGSQAAFGAIKREANLKKVSSYRNITTYNPFKTISKEHVELLNKAEKEKYNTKYKRVEAIMSSDCYKQTLTYKEDNGARRSDKITNCDAMLHKEGLVKNSSRRVIKSFKCLYDGGKVFYQ
jgi:hypothetical protein